MLLFVRTLFLNRERCDQIGLYLKGLGNKISYEVAQLSNDSWKIFCNSLLFSKKCCGYVWEIFGDKIRLLLFPAPGHTPRMYSFIWIAQTFVYAAAYLNLKISDQAQLS